jgi:hypothetical protein
MPIVTFPDRHTESPPQGRYPPDDGAGKSVERAGQITKQTVNYTYTKYWTDNCVSPVFI